MAQGGTGNGKLWAILAAAWAYFIAFVRFLILSKGETKALQAEIANVREMLLAHEATSAKKVDVIWQLSNEVTEAKVQISSLEKRIELLEADVRRQ